MATPDVCVDNSFLKLLGIADMFVYLMGYLDYSSIRSLCNCSVQLQHSKYCFVIWNLTEMKSIQYVSNVQYRESLLQRMSTPNRQLSLKSGCYKNMLSDMSVFKDLHMLDFSWSSQIVDVSALGNVYTLDLSGCNQIADISALGNVHTLNLSKCSQHVNVSALGNVHTLDLSRCNQIVDVSALVNVHTLNLSYCSQLVNVSALGNVHTLDLSYCHQLVDFSPFSPFGNVHTLIVMKRIID